MSEDILEKQLFEIIKDEKMEEHIKVAKIDMLVRLGVDVNALYGAKSALKLANEVNNQKVIEFLENNGAKDVFDEETANELSKKLYKICASEAKDINIAEIKELIDMGADVNECNEYGSTALMMASMSNHKEIVEILIQNGADVNECNEYGTTAFMMASMNNHKKIVEILIQNGADVNHRDRDGDTALIYASNYGEKEATELLIQNGADVNQKNNSGQNAMMVAYNEEIKKAIIDAVKKRNEKTGENVVVQGFERE